MKAYILPYYSRQNRITAVLHGTVSDKDKTETDPTRFARYFHAKGVLLNISDEVDKSLVTRYMGWYTTDEVLHKKTDVIKQIFDPMPGKGSVRY